MDYKEIINFLIEGQGHWVQKSVTPEPLQFLQSIMTSKAKMWIYFICAKYFLAQHVTEVTCDRALLLYAICRATD